MAFTEIDILQEFVEASRTIHDQSALAEGRMWSNKLWLRAKMAEANSRWRSKPGAKKKLHAYWAKYYSVEANRHKKRAYMKKWEAAGGRAAWLASPAGKASRKRACDKYRASNRERLNEERRVCREKAITC